MGTRSDIIVHRRDGSWKRIYCHWDGYPSHHGPILTQHYNTQAKAEALVRPGDLSALGTHVGVKHDFDWSMKLYEKGKKQGFKTYEEERAWTEAQPEHQKYDEMNLYYRRDRGEKTAYGTVGKTLAEVWPGDDAWTEFTYVWDGEGQWMVSSPEAGEGNLVPLADVLAGKKTVQANVKAFGMVMGRWSKKGQVADEHQA